MEYASFLGITSAIYSGSVFYYAYPCFFRDIVISEENSDSGINTVQTPASIVVGFIHAYVIKHISYTKFATLASI